MKKLLYLESGDRRAGIFSYVMQVISMAKVCEDENIPMYIDFSKDMAYYKNGQTTDNVWDYFFKQPYNITNLDEYEKNYAVWYQDNRPLQLPFRYEKDSEFLKQARSYCKKYILIRPELKAVGDSFIKNFIDCKYLAVHKRGTDHENAQYFTIDNYFTETDKYVDKYEKLLVCSDEQYSVDAFKSRYGKRVVSYESVREMDQNANHLGPHGFRKGLHNCYNSNQIYENGRDCVIEAYLLSQANFLLKTLSNVSHFAVMSNEDIDFEWIDRNYKTFY